MKASSLVRSFVLSGEIPSIPYLQIYAEHFPSAGPMPAAGPAPSHGHAAAMAKTLREWAEGLDEVGIEVHQEGAIARFVASASAPLFGRNPQAADARRKTCSFYAAVLEAAARARSANTFRIPATAQQGAVVSAHEALVAARRLAAAAKAVQSFGDVTARPELAAEIERLRNEAGRGVAMHQTAMAEAVACGIAAQDGPWFRIASTVDQLPKGGAMIIGVEVWKGHQTLEAVHANLDPQHGGGTFGLGGQPQGAKAACDAALALRKGGLELPESARYVTPRLDPDSLITAMILSGRIPLSLALACEDRLGQLAVMDSSAPTSEGWSPVFKPASVADDPIWGPLGDLCLRFTQNRDGVTLADLEAAALALLINGRPPQKLKEAQARCDAAWRSAEAVASRFGVEGSIAVGENLPFSSGIWAAGYSRAPIVVLYAPDFQFQGVCGPKFTVGCSRDLGEKGTAFHRAFRAHIAKLEAGWGGPETVTGSAPRPSTVTLYQVKVAARAAAREVGIEPVQSAAVGTQTFPSLC